MQYKTKFSEVQAEGLGEVVAMGIALSGKSFRSLIDSIYSNKIEAPIRELSTNCADSHIEAGIIRPFDIHLPTALDPTFWVRDYGIGMDHAFVTQRYVNLFDSTKDGQRAEDAAAFDPNKTTGSWGLGSKTAFAYTDAYTMTCWDGTEVRIYSLFIGSNGRPDVALVHRGPSDEERGVKVEFAVNPGDIDDFTEAAIRTFKGFHILPNGLPTEVLKEVQQEPTHVGSFFKCYPSGFLGQGFFARQGCVIYPVDLKKVETDTTGFKTLGMSIVLDFPIGSIEYTNSREYLAYTDETVKTLTDGFIAFREEIAEGVNTQLAGIKNRYALAQMAGSNDLFKLSRFAFLSDAHKARASIQTAFEKMLPHKSRDTWKRCLAQCAINQHGDRTRQRAYSFVSGFPEKVGLIWIDELNRNGTPRATAPTDRVVEWLKASDLDYAYVLLDMPKLSELRAMGFPPITRLSAIPQLPKKPRSYTGGGFARLAIAEDKVPDDALFVFKNKGEWVNPDLTPVSGAKEREFNLIAKMLGRKIVTFNIRSNDKLDRFADLDLIYGYSLVKVIEDFTAPQIGALVASINHSRFQALTIAEVVSELDEAGVLGLTPLAPLKRFETAYAKAVRYHQTLLDQMKGVLNAAETDDDEMVNAIIERGRVLGLEILMPNIRKSDRSSGYWRFLNQPLDPKIIPACPEMFIRILSNRNLDKTEIAYLAKEIFA